MLHVNFGRVLKLAIAHANGRIQPKVKAIDLQDKNSDRT